MGKKPFRTVAIHARLPEPHIKAIDAAASTLLLSRSAMVARIVAEWAKAQPKKRSK